MGLKTGGPVSVLTLHCTLKILSHSLKKSRPLWAVMMDDSGPTHTRRKLFKTYKKWAPSKNRLWLLKYAARPTLRERDREGWVNVKDISMVSCTFWVNFKLPFPGLSRISWRSSRKSEADLCPFWVRWKPMNHKSPIPSKENRYSHHHSLGDWGSFKM